LQHGRQQHYRSTLARRRFLTLGVTQFTRLSSSTVQDSAEIERVLLRYQQEAPMHAGMVPKCLAFGVAIFLLLPSKASYSEEVFSYQSVNFRDRFIRHRDFLGFLDKITDDRSALDMAFVTVPGLAGTCQSFIPKNILGGPTGFFLRHQNFRVKLSRFDPQDPTFKEDATFCMERPLASGQDPNALSFGAVNPNLKQFFIRHRDFELVLSPNDGSDLFKFDATFIQKPPVHAPHPIDPG
jgi:hypothetical protein